MPHDSTSDLIITDPDILAGKPVIAGIRISVQLILEKLGDGRSIDNLLYDYPQLSREPVIAAIAYAANAMGNANDAIMRLLLDENISRYVCERLIFDGHDVVRGQDVAAGKPDTE